MANTPCITPNTPPNNYLQNRKPHSQSAGYFHELGGNYKIWKLTVRPHFPSFVSLALVSAGLVRLFGIFVRCLGFYYDISAITVVRAPHRRGTLSGTSGERGETGAGTRILISSDRVSSLAWIQRRRQLRLPGMASVTPSYNIIVTSRLALWVCVLHYNRRDT